MERDEKERRSLLVHMPPLQSAIYFEQNDCYRSAGGGSFSAEGGWISTRRRLGLGGPEPIAWLRSRCLWLGGMRSICGNFGQIMNLDCTLVIDVPICAMQAPASGTFYGRKCAAMSALLT